MLLNFFSPSFRRWQNKPKFLSQASSFGLILYLRVKPLPTKFKSLSTIHFMLGTKPFLVRLAWNKWWRTSTSLFYRNFSDKDKKFIGIEFRWPQRWTASWPSSSGSWRSCPMPSFSDTFRGGFCLNSHGSVQWYDTYSYTKIVVIFLIIKTNWLCPFLHLLIELHTLPILWEKNICYANDNEQCVAT